MENERENKQRTEREKRKSDENGKSEYTEERKEINMGRFAVRRKRKREKRAGREMGVKSEYE